MGLHWSLDRQVSVDGVESYLELYHLSVLLHTGGRVIQESGVDLQDSYVGSSFFMRGGGSFLTERCTYAGSNRF